MWTKKFWQAAGWWASLEEPKCLQTSVYPSTHTFLASLNFPWVSIKLTTTLFGCTTCSTVHTNSTVPMLNLTWAGKQDLTTRENSTRNHRVDRVKGVWWWVITITTPLRIRTRHPFPLLLLTLHLVLIFCVSGLWNSFLPSFFSSYTTSLYYNAAVLQSIAKVCSQ